MPREGGGGESMGKDSGKYKEPTRAKGVATQVWIETQGGIRSL